MSDWEDSVTLEQYILKLFEAGHTDTPEFKILKGIYGREKMAALWVKFKEGKKNEQHGYAEGSSIRQKNG